MKKIDNVKEFVEKIDNSKKLNPKDLSSDQDLSIAIMNLISIEEHLVFSGAKTNKTSFYDLIQDIRELRKNLMQKIIPSYEGEVWCISKHLLASSMRLMEVGTKQQSLGHKDQAYDLFKQDDFPTITIGGITSQSYVITICIYSTSTTLSTRSEILCF